MGPQVVQSLPRERLHELKGGRARHTALDHEALAWVLAALGQYHRIPFDERLVLDQLSRPFNFESVVTAAESIGLRAAWKSRRASSLARLSAPFVAVLDRSGFEPQQGSAAARDLASLAPEAAEPRLAFVLKVEDGRVAFFEQGRQGHVILPLTDFAARYQGLVLLATPERKALTDPDAAGAGREPFGFTWFVPELLKHRKAFQDVLLASLAINVMALATPLFTQVVIDKVVVHHTFNTLMVVGVGLLIFLIFTAALSWLRQNLVLQVGTRIDSVLGAKVLEHLFRLPPRYFEHRPTGILVARLQGMESIRQFIANAFVTLVLELPFMAVFLAVMLWYSWELTLVVTGVLAAITLLSLVMTPAIRRRLNAQFLLGARNQSFLTEYIGGLETVKSLQLEPHLNQRYKEYLDSYLEASLGTRQLANAYQVSAQTLEQAATLVVLCIGAWLVMQQAGFTIGMLVAFQMLATRFFQPMLRMVGLWQEFQQATIAVRRLADLMDAPEEPYSALRSRRAERRGRIEIRRLSFRHAENLPYLFRDLEVDIEAGQCVAIVGPSGAGKSTLAKLLQGFYQPMEGSIRIDGCETRHMSANELRRNLGVVPQETLLFLGTIFDNVAVGQQRSTFDDVVSACKAAGIHDAIEALPQGYQTEVGERGAGLSGGQRQRIAIARALLKRAPILIFDEATSNLDSPAANAVGETINELKGSVTILLIAHHIPDTVHPSKVIRLSGGIE